MQKKLMSKFKSIVNSIVVGEAIETLEMIVNYGCSNLATIYVQQGFHNIVGFHCNFQNSYLTMGVLEEFGGKQLPYNQYHIDKDMKRVIDFFTSEIKNNIK
tara:strand:+ start:39743 stop:40045 length:303 start_codon:yes stop_codon:yes gene_type:complete